MRFTKIEDNKGIINIQGAWSLEETDIISEEIAMVINKGINSFVFDFHGTTSVDSAGIQKIIELKRHFGSDNVKGRNIEKGSDIYYMLRGPKLLDLID